MSHYHYCSCCASAFNAGYAYGYAAGCSKSPYDPSSAWTTHQSWMSTLGYDPNVERIEREAISGLLTLNTYGRIMPEPKKARDEFKPFLGLRVEPEFTPVSPVSSTYGIFPPRSKKTQYGQCDYERPLGLGNW